MQDAWVIEGAYYKWVTPSFERADIIILLNPYVWIRDWRIMKRYLRQLLGKSPARKKETLASFFNLLQWNHTYEKNELAPARALLIRLNKNPIECRTLAQVFAALAKIEFTFP